MESLAMRDALNNQMKNTEAAAALRAKGVNLYNWSTEYRQAFRDAVQASWPEFATTPEANALVASHVAFLKTLGLVK
jgi:hypothetical protein